MKHGSVLVSRWFRSTRGQRLCQAALMMSLAPAAVAAQQQDAPLSCRVDGAPVRVPELPEASGLAVSRRTPGRLWAHNDSGPPVLVALDTQGTVTARVRLTGIAIDDWEALAVGPCRQGSCLYAGDIGDNDAERTGVTVYRFPEPPESADSVAVTDVFHATYPDGAHDAETLLVTDDGTLVIVTKGATGAIALYRFPRTLRTGATHRLERVGTVRDDAKVAGRQRITDGAVSTDGRWIVLRTTRVLTLHRAGALLGGDWRAVGRVDLADLDEPQGEGVAIGRGGTVYLAVEGGGRSRPGTFARLICSALR